MMRKKINPATKGWVLKDYKGHNTFDVCQIQDPNKTYCLKIGSTAFTKAATHDFAPKIRKNIGIFILYDTDKDYTIVTSDIPGNASLMPLVLKKIAKLHRLGLSYEGRIYVDKAKKRVHFTRFRERDKMSPLEWIFELIKDYETLITMHRTEYSNNPKLKRFVRKVDENIKNIAKIL
jgi:hypothetical protein